MDAVEKSALKNMENTNSDYCSSSKYKILIFVDEEDDDVNNERLFQNQLFRRMMDSDRRSNQNE